LSLVLDEHRQYLADQTRVDSFRRAIAEVVKPGDVVLDLASGTGILGLLACKAGASRVYSIDQGGMIEVAREVCRANGYQDRVRFIKGLSTRVSLPEKVDVVVADQIGRFGFDAGVLEFFADARERFLNPGGKLIPGRVDLWVAPVESSELRDQVEFWSKAPAGFNFTPASAIAVNTGYPVKYRPNQLLGTPGRIASLDLATSSAGALEVEARIRTRRAGVLHGIAGWFSAQLSPRVVMTNSPLSRKPIARHCVFFPLDPPAKVKKGAAIQVQMHIRPSDVVVTWKASVSQKGSSPIHFTHSTLRGMLITAEDLMKTRPDSIPRLNPWGIARRSILELVDGSRPLSEIEAEVHRRHPHLFSSRGEAATFVAEVITRYSL
jgi:protein arginine N-methyltransferase 1